MAKEIQGSRKKRSASVCKRAKRMKREKQLDQALEDTFPASDPIALYK